MAEPFIAEIIMFGGNFTPRGWAPCNGQLQAISSNQALFSLLGTNFGGDGRTSFGIPEMRGRLPVHAGSGTGPGLSAYRLGEQGGFENVHITSSTMPPHNHNTAVNVNLGLHAERGPANSNDPDGNMIASHGANDAFKPYDANEDKAMAPEAVRDSGASTVTLTHTGDSAPKSNMQPYLTMNFIIALLGIYPSRN